MAYADPPAKSTGNTFTAADWNTYVKDDILALAHPPFAWVYKTAVQTIANSTLTVVTWPASHVLTGLSLTANAFVPALSGTYRVTCTLEWASNATSLRILTFLVDGAIIRSFTAAPANGSVTTHQATSLFNISAGQAITVAGQQNTGGNLDLTATCEFWAELATY